MARKHLARQQFVPDQILPDASDFALNALFGENRELRLPQKKILIHSAEGRAEMLLAFINVSDSKGLGE